MDSVRLLKCPRFKVSTSLKGGQFEKLDTLRGGEVEKPVSIAGIVFTLSRRPAGVENEVRMSKFVPFLVWQFAVHISGR